MKQGTPKEKHHLRSDRSAGETTFKKTTQPSLYGHAAFCTTTYTHTRTLAQICGRSYENYYFHIVDWFELMSTHSELAKASTSIFKAFQGDKDRPQVIWLSDYTVVISYG